MIAGIFVGVVAVLLLFASAYSDRRHQNHSKEQQQ